MLYKCKRIMLNQYKQMMYYRYKPIMLPFLFSYRYPKNEALRFGRMAAVCSCFSPVVRSPHGGE